MLRQLEPTREIHMTRRSFLSSIAPALVAVAMLGCSDSTDPTAVPPHAAPFSGQHPAADIATLTSAPILYDQRLSTYSFAGFSGRGISLADDFIVPAGATWTVAHLAISGAYIGIGEATPLTLAIRADNGGKPGTPVATFTLAASATSLNAAIAPDLTDYLFTLTTPVTLAPGTYWLTLFDGSDYTYDGFVWLQGFAAARSFGALLSGDDGATWRPIGDENMPTDFAFVLFGPLYPFGGFLSPIAAPPALNAVKAGSAVPVKFTLGGNQGLAVLAAGSPTSTRIACPAAAPVTGV